MRTRIYNLLKVDVYLTKTIISMCFNTCSETLPGAIAPDRAAPRITGTHIYLVKLSRPLCNVPCLVPVCSWCPQTPSSVFWKELALAMPRIVVFHSESTGDPQTMLQDDKDPMLTLNPDYLDCRSDTDPAGDLGKNNVRWTRKE